jgi:hypothetical protein
MSKFKKAIKDTFVEKKKDGGKVKPYQAKGHKDFEYRRNMYNDSLNLYNYTQLQKKLESSTDAPFVQILGMPDDVRKKQDVLLKEADRIVKESKYAGIGKPVIQGDKKREVYKKIGSTDITHPVIKADSEWYGMGSNYDYSNVKPKQEILPPVNKTKVKTNKKKDSVDAKPKSSYNKKTKSSVENKEKVEKPKIEPIKIEKTTQPKPKETFRDTVAPNRIYNQSYGSHGLIDEKGKVTWDRPATAKEKTEAKSKKMANGGKITKKKK